MLKLQIEQCLGSLRLGPVASGVFSLSSRDKKTRRHWNRTMTGGVVGDERHVLRAAEHAA